MIAGMAVLQVVRFIAGISKALSNSKGPTTGSKTALPFRRRERAMLRFRRMESLQKFASVHANVQSL